MAYLTRHHLAVPRVAFCVLLVVVVGACVCSPASALSQRGHDVGGLSFGISAGEEASVGVGLSEPGAIAVSVFTGDVYVVDRGHNRIVQFAPRRDGEGVVTGYGFVSAWGWGVTSGVKRFDVCTAHCRAGVAGTGKYQFNRNVLGVAVDNCTARNAAGEVERETDGALKPCANDPSAGDVYVAGEHYDRGEEENFEGVAKFTADGQGLEQVDGVAWEAKEEPNGLCETKHGRVVCVEEFAEPEEAHGFAVGPEGTPWLYYEEELYRFSDVKLSETGGYRWPLGVSSSLANGPGMGLALDAQGHFYLGEEIDDGHGGGADAIARWDLPAGEGVRELVEAPSSPQALDGRDTAAVAVNPLDIPENGVDEEGDVYILTPEHENGEYGTSVGQYDVQGRLLQRFDATGVQHAGGLAVDPADGGLLVSDAQTGEITRFGLAQASAPTVDDVGVREVTGETALLQGQVDSDGQSTEYVFEYGTAPCAQVSSGCARVTGSLAGVFGDRGVQAQLSGLQPGRTYRYRLLAKNTDGEAESGEGVFATPAASAGDVGFADGRGWEMVSPADKGGANVEPVPTENGGLVQAAAGGDAFSYIATSAFAQPEGNRSVEPSQILSIRDPQTGWNVSKDLTTPGGAGLGLTLGTEKEYEFFSEDLSLSLLTPFRSANTRWATPPLAPPVSEDEHERMRSEQRNGEPLAYQEQTTYLRDDQGVQPQGVAERTLYQQAERDGERMDNPGYLALVNGLDAPGVAFGGEEGPVFLDATPDLSHAVFEAGVPLLAGESTKGLYEWSGGQDVASGILTSVNILPQSEGGGAVEGALGLGDRLTSAGAATTFRHAISNDGTRVIWTALGRGLFMRETVRGETIRIAPASAKYQSASVDGSRVFFTDSKPLTPQSGEEGKPDLYACEIQENDITHVLEECTVQNQRLVDLTPVYENTNHQLESADVQGLILGASEEGTAVYFVASGALGPEAPATSFCDRTSKVSVEDPISGDEQELLVPSYAGETCNLYVVVHNNGVWQAPRFIKGLSSEDEHDWRSWYIRVPGEGEQSQGELTSRVSPDGRYLAFMSELSLTGYDNRATNPTAENAPTEETYLYDLNTNNVVCASCAPTDQRPVGVRIPLGFGHVLVNETATWQNRWLAASLPEAPSIVNLSTDALYQSRYLSNSGRLYFNTPETLVPEDRNNQQDVYEYEPLGVPQGRHACTTTTPTYNPQTAGCVGLISSGTSSSESLFLDASETGGEGPDGKPLATEGGGDVFFLSAAKLVPEDIEDTYAAYDAHECTTASPCIPPTQEKPPPACETNDACHPNTTTTPPTATTTLPASATSNPSGNVIPKHSVSPSKAVRKAKPLTASQRLLKALHTCRSRYKHHKHKRIVCEQQARRRYVPHGRMIHKAATGHTARNVSGR